MGRVEELRMAFLQFSVPSHTFSAIVEEACKGNQKLASTVVPTQLEGDTCLLICLNPLVSLCLRIQHFNFPLACWSSYNVRWLFLKCCTARKIPMRTPIIDTDLKLFVKATIVLFGFAKHLFQA